MLKVPHGRKTAGTAVRLAGKDEWGYIEVHGDARYVQVFIDGMLEGKVPFRRKLKPGTYELMVGPSGKIPWKSTVVVEAGKTVVQKPAIAQKEAAAADGDKPPDDGLPPGVDKLNITRKPEPDGKKRSHVGQWLTIGGGGALIVVGGILQGAAYSRNEQLREDYPDGIEGAPVSASNKTGYEEGFENEVRPRMVGAYICYGLGGAAAAAGAIWLIVDAAKGPEEKTKGLKVAPMVGPNGFGATLGLEF